MRWLIEQAIRKRVITYFISGLLLVGGIASFFSLGQLEDPVFSVKSASIVTRYPGASPKEVELEVTDLLEQAIQEMPEVKDIYSISRAGQSFIKVDIKDKYWSDRLPQIWDQLRNKISDAAKHLPAEAEEPIVNDDFGFVYGFLLAITGDGFSDKDLESYAKTVKKELSQVKDVARVDLWGVQKKVIYLDISEQQLSQLRITPETFISTLQNQNAVVDGGGVDNNAERFRISPSGEFTSPFQVGELIIRPKANDIITNALYVNQQGSQELLSRLMEDESQDVIKVKDVAKVRQGYLQPPFSMMRFNGKPSIGIAIAGTDDSNIVDVGRRLAKAIDQIENKLPIGLDLHRIAWQSDLVEEAVNGFLVSLAQAILIVIVVLIIPSGYRMGLIIGVDLILTILGTFIVMAIMQIPLQRMSLGALIIALGMMVDNSIVVSDSIAVKIRQGVDRMKAAVDAAYENWFPLFAATLIAVMTFYPIYGSEGSTGEYCATLFIVVATSLLLSWAISLLLTPIKCVNFLPDPKGDGDGEEFKGGLFEKMRSLLKKLIRFRLMTAALLVGMLVISIVCFGFVKQMFFPESSRPQLMIDYWASDGTKIQDVAANLEILEEKLLKDDRVECISSFIGLGPPRFYLPVDPERNNQNYGQLILNFSDYRDIDSFIDDYTNWVAEKTPDAMVRFRKYGVGPADTWKFELRITGVGEASVDTLRSLGNEVLSAAQTSPYGRDWRLDMMNPVLKVVPEYDQKRGRWSQVSRSDVASATRRSFDGVPVGQYREGDTLYPILARNTQTERAQLLNNFESVQVNPSGATWTVPLSQVTSGVDTKWEDPIIARWNRRRQVSVQGEPSRGFTFPTLYADVIDQIDKIKLPSGFEFVWDGEYDSTATAQAQLLPGLIPAAVVILLLLVLVFNAFRPVLIILMTIPFAVIGITWGLLILGIPFGFMALLGGMSLAGMMNKNIVVLLDACVANLESGMPRYHAIIEASVSRTRPVLLAAGTTILGVVPLVQDVFWTAMAATIMSGLAFGSLLTLVCVPVFYCLLYRVKEEKG